MFRAKIARRSKTFGTAETPRHYVLDDAMRRSPALFSEFSRDPRFTDMLMGLDAEFEELMDPNATNTARQIAAKQAARTIAPFQRDFYAAQQEAARRRAWDLRPVDERPHLVFDDAEPDPRTLSLKEATIRTRSMLNPAAVALLPQLRELAMKTGRYELRRLGEEPHSILLCAKHIQGYPSAWERFLRPERAARKIAMCEAVAARLSEDWTNAKDTYREGLRIRHLEQALPAMKSVLEFVLPYQQELDAFTRTGRLTELREKERARAGAKRATADSHARTVVNFAEYLPRGRNRHGGRER